MIKSESLFAENVISARRLFFAKKEKNKFLVFKSVYSKYN